MFVRAVRPWLDHNATPVVPWEKIEDKHDEAKKEKHRHNDEAKTKSTGGTASNKCRSRRAIRKIEAFSGTASSKCRSRRNAIRKIEALAASAGATANTNVDLSFAAGLNALDHMVGNFRIYGQHRPCRYRLCHC